MLILTLFLCSLAPEAFSDGALVNCDELKDAWTKRCRIEADYPDPTRVDEDRKRFDELGEAMRASDMLYHRYIVSVLTSTDHVVPCKIEGDPIVDFVNEYLLFSEMRISLSDFAQHILKLEKPGDLFWFVSDHSYCRDDCRRANLHPSYTEGLDEKLLSEIALGAVNSQEVVRDLFCEVIAKSDGYYAELVESETLPKLMRENMKWFCANFKQLQRIHGRIQSSFDTFMDTGDHDEILRQVNALKDTPGAKDMRKLLAETFVPIFDGRTLDGWKASDMSYWTVEERAITGTISEEHPLLGDNALVWQGGEVGDFELEMLFQLTALPQTTNDYDVTWQGRNRGESDAARFFRKTVLPNTNCGLQFRGQLVSSNSVVGYRVDIDRNSDSLVRLYDEQGRGVLALRGESARFDEHGVRTVTFIEESHNKSCPFSLDCWPYCHLSVHGSHLELWINGQKTAEVFDDDSKQQDLHGILALQLHPGNPMKVQFKSIRLKRLDGQTPMTK